MEYTLKLLAGSPAFKTREAMFNGRNHLVVPVVALVEGVLQTINAENPEFVAASEFTKAPAGWNGRPIFVDHPMKNGVPVYGNTPELLENAAIGQVFNTAIRKNKLCMEAWIDIEKCEEIDSDLLDRIASGDPIEISVGLACETDDSIGVHNGKSFKGAWHELVPDHLAILSAGKTGACSRKMGCGVRAAIDNGNNQYSHDNQTKPKDKARADKLIKRFDKSTGNFADNLHEMDAEDIASQFGLPKAEATRVYNHVQKATTPGPHAAEGEVMEHMYGKWLEAGPETDELLKVLRNIPQNERDKMPEADFAGPNRSFPIAEPQDVSAAASSLGRAKGNRNEIKRKIIAIAYRKGESFVANLPEDWKKKKDQKNASGFARLMDTVRAMIKTAQTPDEMTGGDLNRKLYDALRDVEPTIMVVEDYFPVSDPTHVVYSCFDSVTGYCGMFERAFELSDSGVVTLNAARIEVEPVRTYEPVEGASPVAAEGCKCGGHKAAEIQPSAGDETMKSEKIAKYLETATPEQIAALELVVEGKEAPAVVEAKAAQAKAEADLKTAQAAAKDAELKTAVTETPEYKAAVEHLAAKKTATIKALMATGRCDKTEEQLKALSQADLDSMVKLAGSNVRAAIDFSGQAPRTAQEIEQTAVPAAQDTAAAIKAARATK